MSSSSRGPYHPKYRGAFIVLVALAAGAAGFAVSQWLSRTQANPLGHVASPMGPKKPAARPSHPSTAAVSTAVEGAPSSQPGSAALAPMREMEAPTTPARLAAEFAKSTPLRDRMAALKRVQLDQRYGRLLNQWDLAPNDRQAVFDLLLEGDLANTDHGMSLVAASPEERVRLTEEFAESQRALDQRLQAALTPQHYAELREFTESLPIRLQVDALTQRLARTSEPLVPDQQAALVALLASSRSSQGSMDTAMSGLPQGVVDDVALGRLRQAMEENDERASAQAAAVLAPGQLEAFRQFQRERTLGTMRGLELMKQPAAPK